MMGTGATPSRPEPLRGGFAGLDGDPGPAREG